MCKKHPVFYPGVRQAVNPAYDRNHRPGFVCWIDAVQKFIRLVNFT